MSAFALIWKHDGETVDAETVTGMLTRLRHKGPGTPETLIDGNIGFGSIESGPSVGPKRTAGPIKRSGSGIVVVGDIRIDNRDELVALVGDSRTGGLTDEDLISLCFEKLGTEAFARIVGDFAFALWDPRDRKLHCARDSMGVKHFYYYQQPGRFFALASEIKALFEIPEIPAELDDRAIGDYLIFNYQDKEATLFKGIKRLPANSEMVVIETGVRIRTSWLPSGGELKGLRSSGDFEEAFREVLETSVRARTSGPGPVGTMLSGGLDSSTITCLSSRYLSEEGSGPLLTYSAIFPDIAKKDARIDEREFIDSVVAHSGCRPQWVVADNFSPFRNMGALQERTDHPVGAPNVFMDWAIMEAAGKKGTRVLLSGFDGDSAVSYGYEGFEGMARRRQLFRLLRSARQLGRNMPGRHHQFRKLVWNQGLRPVVPSFIRTGWRILNRIDVNYEEERVLPSQMRFCCDSLQEDFVKEHQLEERYFSLLDANHPRREDEAQEFWDAVCNGMFAFALETLEKASAAFGLEQRYPFFDRRLIEFCASLPGWQKVHGGWTRSILRRATAGVLPEDVRWRTDKANIGVSFKLNLHKFGADDLKEAIFDRSEVLEPFVDIGKLRSAYRRFMEDPLRYEGEPVFLNSCVNLSHWIRKIRGETDLDLRPTADVAGSGAAGSLTTGCEQP